MYRSFSPQHRIQTDVLTTQQENRFCKPNWTWKGQYAELKRDQVDRADERYDFRGPAGNIVKSAPLNPVPKKVTGHPRR